MDLRRYAWLVRRHWILITATMTICAFAGATYATQRTPAYESKLQFFISTSGTGQDLAQAYQGGLFSQQRVASYAEVVSSPAVVRAVIDRLRLDESVDAVQRRIKTAVVADTVLIDVTVRDRIPRRAQAIAAAVGTAFPRFLQELERPHAGAASPVRASVTEPPQVPASPAGPGHPFFVLIGLVLGTVAGIGAAVLREAFDPRVRNEEDAEHAIDMPVIGTVLAHRKARRSPLVVASQPRSAAADAFRRLRTMLDASDGMGSVSSFVVSSACAQEGKTLVAANLAVAFAQDGRRVVLVDADLRHPKLAQVFGAPNDPGLSAVLGGDLPIEAALYESTVDIAFGSQKALPLRILTAGPLPTNPTGLLGSPGLAALFAFLRAEADIVIVDTPPLLRATDAAIISRLTAGVVLVTRAGGRSADLGAAGAYLHALDLPILGVVFNCGRRDRSSRRRPGALWRSSRRSPSAVESHRGSSQEAPRGTVPGTDRSSNAPARHAWDPQPPASAIDEETATSSAGGQYGRRRP